MSLLTESQAEDMLLVFAEPIKWREPEELNLMPDGQEGWCEIMPRHPERIYVVHPAYYLDVYSHRKGGFISIFWDGIQWQYQNADGEFTLIYAEADDTVPIYADEATAKRVCTEHYIRVFQEGKAE